MSWVNQIQCRRHLLYSTYNQQDSPELHCPTNSLNLRLKPESVTVEAEATVYVRFLCQIEVPRNRCTCLLGLYAKIQIMLGTVYMQCIVYSILKVQIEVLKLEV